MPNITGHTELVGLMAYPIRHTQSPTTHNLAYDKNGDDVIDVYKRQRFILCHKPYSFASSTIFL